MNDFRKTGSLRPGNVRGGDRTVRIPENIERARQVVEASPRQSAVRHSRALRMSDHSVYQIFYLNLNFHPYKMMVIQELPRNDYGRRMRFIEAM